MKTEAKVVLPPGFLSVEEVAEKVGRTGATVRNWCIKGILKAHKFDQDTWGIPLEEFKRLVSGEIKIESKRPGFLESLFRNKEKADFYRIEHNSAIIGDYGDVFETINELSAEIGGGRFKFIKYAGGKAVEVVEKQIPGEPRTEKQDGFNIGPVVNLLREPMQLSLETNKYWLEQMRIEYKARLDEIIQMMKSNYEIQNAHHKELMDVYKAQLESQMQKKGFAETVKELLEAYVLLKERVLPTVISGTEKGSTKWEQVLAIADRILGGKIANIANMIAGAGNTAATEQKQLEGGNKMRKELEGKKEFFEELKAALANGTEPARLAEATVQLQEDVLKIIGLFNWYGSKKLSEIYQIDETKLLEFETELKKAHQKLIEMMTGYEEV